MFRSPKCLHVVGAILRVRFNAVTGDGNNLDSLGGIVPGKI